MDTAQSTLNTEQQPIGSGFGLTSTAAEVMAGVDLTDRTAVVTGGASGLGYETVLALAAAGARVIVPVRRAVADVPEFTAAEGASEHRGRIDVVPGVDLGDPCALPAAAERIAELAGDGIDLFIAAAGVMATPQQPVGPGWDYQLTINHLGHFSLITRLYPLLAKQGARVVVYSSAGHRGSDIRWDDPHFLRGYDKWVAYGQSKTANSLFAVHLDALGRTDNVRAFSLNPGNILTRLQRDLPQAEMVAAGWIDESGAPREENFTFKTPSQGAATGLWAATSPSLDGRGGLYLEDCDIAPVAADRGQTGDPGVQSYAVDPASAERLWTLTSALVASDIRR